MCLEPLLDAGSEAFRDAIGPSIHSYLEGGDRAALRTTLRALADLADADATPAPSVSLSLCA